MPGADIIVGLLLLVHRRLNGSAETIDCSFVNHAPSLESHLHVVQYVVLLGEFHQHLELLSDLLQLTSKDSIFLLQLI